MSLEQLIWNSMFDITSTSSTTSTVLAATPTSVDSPTTVIPTPTPTATVDTTPSADCSFWDQDLVAYQFEVYNLQNWAVSDSGAALKTQEDGCGALTLWRWTDATYYNEAYVYFDLSFFIKSGCVERAIVSAGGPKLSCVGRGSDSKRNNEVASGATEPVYLPATAADLQILQETYGNATKGEGETYVPMDWGE